MKLSPSPSLSSSPLYRQSPVASHIWSPASIGPIGDILGASCMQRYQTAAATNHHHQTAIANGTGYVPGQYSSTPPVYCTGVTPGSTFDYLPSFTPLTGNAPLSQTPLAGACSPYASNAACSGGAGLTPIANLSAGLTPGGTPSHSALLGSLPLNAGYQTSRGYPCLSGQPLARTDSLDCDYKSPDSAWQIL